MLFALLKKREEVQCLQNVFFSSDKIKKSKRFYWYVSDHTWTAWSLTIRGLFNIWGKPHTKILLFNTWGKPHANNIQYLRQTTLKSYYSILEANRMRIIFNTWGHRTSNLTIQYLRQTAHEILLFNTWGKPHMKSYYSILEANSTRIIFNTWSCRTRNFSFQYLRQTTHQILLFNTLGKSHTKSYYSILEANRKRIISNT
jgi:hypothetical protein